MKINELINKILIFLGLKQKIKTINPYSNISKNGLYIYNDYELEIMALINQYRLTIGLKVLLKNDYISLLCEEHNNEMIIDGKASHNGFVDRANIIIETIGVKKVGENVAFKYRTPLAVLNAWLKSSKHKKNIEGDYTHFGVSIVGYYYTNIFINK